MNLWLLQVRYWITFNEPWVITHMSYGVGFMAPGLQDPGQGGYITGHVLLKAHAEAYYIYDEEFRETQNGIYEATGVYGNINQ